MSKPKVWYITPESHTRRVFRPEVYAGLLERYDLVATEGDQRVTAEEVTRRAPEFEAIVTGWGSPPFADEGLAGAGRLRLVAHSAGSVKFLFTERAVREILIPRGIIVSSANQAIAENVAEATVGYMIAVSRRWFEQMRHVRETGGWHHPEASQSRQFLRGATVGLVSASAVGREVIRMLQPFDVRTLLYDPYLEESAARQLGVTLTSLDELLAASDIVSLHAPSIPATRHMIGERQLRRLRDGALLINTSRGSVLDHDALLREARSGRFQVVLDVTEPEPLPPDHPLRSLPNVWITPHVSGAGSYGYFHIGDTAAAALEDCFAGRPVTGAVDLARWDQLA